MLITISVWVPNFAQVHSVPLQKTITMGLEGVVICLRTMVICRDSVIIGVRLVLTSKKYRRNRRIKIDP